MTELEKLIYEHVSVHDTRKRDLLQRFHRRGIREVYQSMVDNGLIYEEGSGKAGDPKNVRAGRLPVEPDYHNLLPFVTSVPRTVWVDFLVRCVEAKREPEQVLTELLGRAIEAPTISQNVDRGY